MQRFRYVIALAASVALIAVAVVSLSLYAQDGPGPAALKAGQQAAGRFSLVAGPMGDKHTAAFVIDEATMRLLVYSYDQDTRLLRLVAVRDISEDVRLSHYNNERPWPEDIRQRVEQGEPAGKEPAAPPKP